MSGSPRALCSPRPPSTGGGLPTSAPLLRRGGVVQRHRLRSLLGGSVLVLAGTFAGPGLAASPLTSVTVSTITATTLDAFVGSPVTELPDLDPDAARALDEAASAAGALVGPASVGRSPLPVAGPAVPVPLPAPPPPPEPAPVEPPAPAAASPSPVSPPPTQPAPPPAAPPVSPGGPTAAQWAALRDCESHGDYQAVSSTGRYRGAYQFSQETWNMVASRLAGHLSGVDPAAAAPADQDMMAQGLYDLAGPGQWPHCGRHLR